MNYDSWKPYVPVAQRRAKAARAAAKLSKGGAAAAPIHIAGLKIAKTFWGKAWCDNLESYSDYENRLPRGRTYVRNGSVVDLKIAGGEVKALVSGSSLYKVAIKIAPLPAPKWQAICRDCAGSIDSLVELLQGRLSSAVMQRVCQQKTGLFPAPAEITLDCSCPDWATMCKHVAAVLYGVGARLDEQPQLIFQLRAVDEAGLIAQAASAQTLAAKGPTQAKVLDDDLGALFGLDMDGDEAQPVKPAPAKKAAAKKTGTKKVVAKKAVAKKAPAKKAPAKKSPAKKAPGRRATTNPAAPAKPVPAKAKKSPTAATRRSRQT